MQKVFVMFNEPKMCCTHNSFMLQNNSSRLQSPGIQRIVPLNKKIYLLSIPFVKNYLNHTVDNFQEFAWKKSDYVFGII